MTNWYLKISAAPDGDFSAVAEAIEWFDKEYQQGRQEIQLSGRLEDCAKRLPGLVEYYYRHLQELDAILQWFEIKIAQAQARARNNLLETSQRAINERTAEKWAETDDNVIDLKMLYNLVGLTRNYFFGIHKALEASNFQLSNITKLRLAGVEDATI